MSMDGNGGTFVSCEGLCGSVWVDFESLSGCVAFYFSVCVWVSVSVNENDVEYLQPISNNDELPVKTVKYRLIIC